MKNFFEQIKNSVYGPVFYKKLENQNFSYTAKYLLKLSFFTSFLSVLVLMVMFFVFKINFLAASGIENLNQFGQKYLENNFPNDLVVNFQNGILSTNKNEPTIFPIPVEWFGSEFENEQRFINFVTIDQNENISLESFRKYNSYAILSSTTGAFFDSEKNSVNFFKYTDENFKDVDNLSIDKNTAINNVNSVSEYLLKILPYFMLYMSVLYFIIVGIMIFIGTLIFSIFIALLSWLIGKIWGINKDFTTWYLKGIHANTLYILLAWTVGFVFPFTMVPFAGTILVLLVLFFNDNFKK